MMKKNLHPELHEVVAHCACGARFKTRSTLSELKVTLCSQCHPYFTGAQKFVDTAGRIEKFQKRYEKGAAKVADSKAQSEAAKAVKFTGKKKK
jgi:large subunit ribosomal protein L31